MSTNTGEAKVERPLPQFRQDLRVFRGPEDEDGSSTYTVYDPVRGKYYKFSWAEWTVYNLFKPGMTIAQLKQEVVTKSTLEVSEEDIRAFFQHCDWNHLLQRARSSEELQKEKERTHVNPLTWALTNYLFLRIPLVNPSAFLVRTLQYVKPLVSYPALIIYLAMGMFGMYQLVVRFDEFLGTFTYFFNFQGLVWYALVLTGVKIIHEFAHAYTAMHYNVTVRTMGVAILVFWPVLYTDVTDSWRLHKRSQRLAISCAGIAAELLIAGMATFGWAVTSPGVANSIFFVIASATWLATLIINLNPALRFDGYYILSDLWRFDNLRPRSFAIARWQLRKWLLGLNVPSPEEGMSQGRINGCVVFSIYVWIYRLFLFTAIAVIIYYKFTKVLGVFLFVAEIVLFLIWPVTSEFYQLNQLKSFWKPNFRAVVSILGVSFLAAWFILPLPRAENFPAITIASLEQSLYVPSSAFVKEIHVKRGDTVEAGDLLVTLHSPEVDYRIANLAVQTRLLQNEIDILSGSEEEQVRAVLPEKIAEISVAREKLVALQQIRERLIIEAQFSGSVVVWDDMIRVGQAVAKNQVMGKIADLSSLEIFSFIPEALEEYISIDQEVIFRLKGSTEDVKGTIKKILPFRTESLKYQQLASIYGGELPVTYNPKKNKRRRVSFLQASEQMDLKVLESYYVMQIAIDPSSLAEAKVPVRIEHTGVVLVKGLWRSHLVTLLKKIGRVFWRESGF